ncbi:hypothetical protein [Clostridium oryzae]|uniref:Uncharacterized protein n=1 Tax=Clostridium oryzae TaxID=1450648 RepID=A0A1V4IUN0_9CLOT|nr:hypothetical protein [Clostridium oryzae]OPJ63603.1 hypothetical protein CLORY_11110 [Clostridium oryzae]
MNIVIREMSKELFSVTAKMITQLMNYHRKLNNAPKEYWQIDEESEEDLKCWTKEGTVYNILLEGVVSMFVDAIPRNTGAIKLYRECGFDHLNLIQLRKNYDKNLDKKEEIDILGFNFKKY